MASLEGRPRVAEGVGRYLGEWEGGSRQGSEGRVAGGSPGRKTQEPALA